MISKSTLLRKASTFSWMLALAAFTAQAQPFTTQAGLLDQTKTNDLGLAKATGTETVTVFKATASSDHYSNGVVMVGFKGYLYCQWQSSDTNEDSPDTWVAYSRSQDGKTWTAPMQLALPFNSSYCTSGGWWVNGDTLVAFVNVWPSSLTPRGGFAYYRKSTDGMNWTPMKQVTMSDGTVMKGIFEQDPHALPDGRIINAVHFQPGLICSPVYSDDPVGYRGWRRATFTPMAYTGDVTREIEPSWFRKSDGTAVMVFRDQMSTYRKLAATSTNRGQTWTTAVLTDMPDSRAKQSAGNLPDGTAYIVSNPVDGKTRYPLAIVLSKDGAIFTKAYLLRAGGSDLQAQQYTGTAKTIGYSYPKSTIWNGYLYAAYSTQKEDVEYTRIPLSSISLNPVCTSGSMDDCGRCVGGTTGKTACAAAAEAETEACLYDGTIDNNNAGFKGTGFINVPNLVGSKIIFGIAAATSGTKTISLRYASGGTATRPADIFVNGTKISTLSFPATGAFTTYGTIDIPLSLNAGANTIQFVATTSDGLPNIDQIGYVSSGVTKGGCVVTGTTNNEHQTTNYEVYPNPSKSSFHLNSNTEADIQVLDTKGNLLEEHKSVVDIEFGQNLPAGLYFVKVGSKVFKAVKE